MKGITKLFFENKIVSLPINTCLKDYYTVDDKIIIRINKVSNIISKAEQQDALKESAQGMWCLTFDGQILWKSEPYFDILKIPQNELTSMYFLPIEIINISDDKKTAIGIFTTMAEIHIDIETGKTIKKTMGYKN